MTKFRLRVVAASLSRNLNLSKPFLEERSLLSQRTRKRKEGKRKKEGEKNVGFVRSDTNPRTRCLAPRSLIRGRNLQKSVFLEGGGLDGERRGEVS